MTRWLIPHFGDADMWRQIVRNNEPVHHATITLRSDEVFLPRVLVEAGFFPSTSQIRKNRPDLWRLREPFDDLQLQWAQIEVWPA